MKTRIRLTNPNIKQRAETLLTLEKTAVSELELITELAWIALEKGLDVEFYRADKDKEVTFTPQEILAAVDRIIEVRPNE